MTDRFIILFYWSFKAEGNKDKRLHGQQFNATADQLGANSKSAGGKHSCAESMQKDRLDGFFDF